VAIAIILFFVNMRSQFGAVIGGAIAIILIFDEYAIAVWCCDWWGDRNVLFFCEYAMKIN
jgi:hypothetical protein